MGYLKGGQARRARRRGVWRKGVGKTTWTTSAQARPRGALVEPSLLVISLTVTSSPCAVTVPPGTRESFWCKEWKMNWSLPPHSVFSPSLRLRLHFEPWNRRGGTKHPELEAAPAGHDSATPPAALPGVPRAAPAEGRGGRGGEEEAAAAADVAATQRRLNTRWLPSARPGPAPEPTLSSAAPRPPGRLCARYHWGGASCILCRPGQRAVASPGSLSLVCSLLSHRRRHGR